MFNSLRKHWPEYLIEAGGLGAFMVFAGGFATLLFSPASPLDLWITLVWLKRILMGIAMGLTAIALIYSPWGKRSGAHLNPAVSLAFCRLGKLTVWDTFFYVLAQFVGGILGVKLVAYLLADPFVERPVQYIVTVPGQGGTSAALVVEFLMAFGLMMMVLIISNHERWFRYTGVFAGVLISLYISLAAPISGMSINPARSFASALPAHIWTSFWIYFLAPPLAMLMAVELYLRWTNANPRKLCGKLCPNSEMPCLCTYCCCDAQDALKTF